jgi:hypothetical protein
MKFLPGFLLLGHSWRFLSIAGGTQERAIEAAQPRSAAWPAENLHKNTRSSERSAQTRCEGAMHPAGMAKIIPVQFRPSRLPRRLLNDAWWLESAPVRFTVITFPKRNSPKPETGSKTGRKPRRGHLTLVIPEK